MSRKRAGIDLDGVCYDWDSSAKFLLSHSFGYSLDVTTRWNHIKDSVHAVHWEWLWTEGVKLGLFRHGNLYRGSIEALRTLDRKGHNLVIITTRPDSARVDTLDWLSYHKIPAKEVHVLGQGANKANVECDWYVDDMPNNVSDICAAGKTAYLFDRSWNRECRDGVRVASWAELLYHHGIVF